MPDSDMLKAAEAEVKKLEAELAATPLGQKLALARQVVALYRGPPPQQDLTPPTVFGVRPLKAGDLLSALEQAETKTKVAQIEIAAIKYLMSKRARATSGELLEVMRREGIEIGGKEPNKALSAYLSGFKSLNNVREFGGYGLADWGHNKGPDLLTQTGAA